MNQARRKRMKKALDLAEEARGILSEIRDEEAECYANMPENLQEGEKGTRMEENIIALETAIDILEEMDCLKDCLN